MSIPLSEQPSPTPEGRTGQVGLPNGVLPERGGVTCEACPWVGTWRDPVPYYAFPARVNYCYRVKPATSIKLEHQTAYCLSPNYIRCPIYRQQEVVVLPDRAAKRKGVKLGRPLGSGRWPRPSRQAVSRFVLFLLFVAAALLLAAGWYYQGGVAARLPTEMGIPATATDVPGVLVTEAVVTPSPSATRVPTVTPTATPTNRPTATATKRPAATVTDTPMPSATTTSPAVTETPTVTGCVPPAGWVEYVVRPGDSLFRLGQRFGATVVALQQGNCMGSGKVIYVGQRLYVPGVEVTPTATDFEENE
jgi:LysM repeat protein